MALILAIWSNVALKFCQPGFIHSPILKHWYLFLWSTLRLTHQQIHFWACFFTDEQFQAMPHFWNLITIDESRPLKCWESGKQQVLSVSKVFFSDSILLTMISWIIWGVNSLIKSHKNCIVNERKKPTSTANSHPFVSI